MYLTSHPPKPRVFQRTVRGQQAVLVRSPELTSKEMRLLLMINGETPMDHLMQLAPDVMEPLLLNHLMQLGLIESSSMGSEVRNGSKAAWLQALSTLQ